MKNLRRWWIGVVGGGVLAAAGLGTLLWWQHGQIEAERANVATLRGTIDS